MNSSPVGSTLNQEILALKSKLGLLTKERNLLEEALGNEEVRNSERQDVKDARGNYENRLTEISSVIQHLQKQLDAKSEKIIVEESAEEDEHTLDNNIPHFDQLLPDLKKTDSTNLNMGSNTSVKVEKVNQNNETILTSPPSSNTQVPCSPDPNSNTLVLELGKRSPIQEYPKPRSPPAIPENLQPGYGKIGNSAHSPQPAHGNINVGGESGNFQAKEKIQHTNNNPGHGGKLEKTEEVEGNRGGEILSRTEDTGTLESRKGKDCGTGEKHRKSKTRRKKLHHQNLHVMDSNENPQSEEMSPPEDGINWRSCSIDETFSSANKRKTGNKKTLSGPVPGGQGKTLGSNGYPSPPPPHTVSSSSYSSSLPPTGNNRTGIPGCCETQLIPPEKPPRVSHPDNLIQFASLRNEVAQIREEHFAIRDTLARKEGELDRTRDALENIASERDFLKNKVIELECLLKQSPKNFGIFSSTSPLPMEMSKSETPSPCKMAERVKLNQHCSRGRKDLKDNNNSGSGGDQRPSTLNYNNCHYHHHHHHLHNHGALHCNVKVEGGGGKEDGLVGSGSSGLRGQREEEEREVQDSSPGKISHSSNGKRGITGHELSTIGPTCNARIMEHLLQPIQDESIMLEMQHAIESDKKSDAETRSIIQDKFHEFEIETDRLHSRLEHLRSQNDVLSLNLEDAKGHSDRLTVLLGRYESNNIGHQITLNLSDQLIDAYDVLVALLESELGLLLANCRAAGIGAPPPTSPSSASGHYAGCQDDIDVASLLQRANDNRMTAEIAARNLIIRMLDSPGSENNNCLTNIMLPIQSHQNHLPPWEDASSGSQTLSSASSVGASSNHSQTPSGSSGSASRGVSIEKNEESRVRDYIIQLKTEREAVRGTLVELENWSLEPLSPEQPSASPCDILEARKMDLETAVLMQELMAMREDRAELRAQLFLVEKEKTSVEYRLGGYDAQLDAYRARINHLKAEISDLQHNTATTTPSNDNSEGNINQNSPQQLDGNVNNNNTITEDRELVLKKRIHDLASSLEKITYNANLREQQSTETVNELKKANGILMDTLENVKKKYQNRVKKMEEQILSIMEKHSLQMKLYKDRLNLLEMELMDRHHHH